ncbi:hypothetical protein [Arthrobacter sp. SO3]|uniref:hypothetical protein n=1 Tax=Arthrobacter sp. SO3 TaxID=1897057 RepID=UPI001CFF6B46|nr:hypothetical protein [Arthrobacter sp. SO3]MCB5294187.1 hypothetical protein [Arthrobacter sp. SO3]
MATCDECKKEFDVGVERDEFNIEFPEDDIDYDEEIEGGPQCASCVGSRIESNNNVGRAIDMMNGDEDYDGDHVEKYL